MTTLRSLSMPLFLVALLALPYLLGGSPLVFGAAILIAILAVAAYGLDLVVSDLGEVSFAQPVFLGIGAYATAILSTRHGAPPAVTLAGAVIVALAVAALLGLITLRLRGFAFSLVTYAVGVVAIALASNWEFLGGSDGIRGIPVFTIGWAGFAAKTDAALWPVAYALLVATLWFVSAFRRSSLGLAAVMVHQNPRLAVMSGIDPQRTRLMTFLVSAPITAAAGWLYAYQRAFVSADILETYFLVATLTAVVLVGRRLLLAPLIGTAIILLQEKFLSLGGYADKIFLGGLLVLVLAYCPGGLVGLWRSIRRLGRNQHAG